MRLKYRVSLAVISILMVMTLFVSSSYALWSVSVSQTQTNLIESGCFDIDIESVSSSINLNNTYPMEDDKGKKLQPYIFKVKNNCTVDATYTLYLSEFEPTSTVESSKQQIRDYIKVAISKGNQAVITTQKLEDTSVSDQEKKLVKETTKIADIKFDNKTIKNTYKITTGELKGQTDKEAGEEETFELRMWIDSTADKDIMNQTFEAGISAIAYATDLSKTTQSSVGS